MIFSKKIDIDKALSDLFIEIRDQKKIIDGNIRLVPDEKIKNFQGLNFFNIIKRINYNPIFYEEYLSKANENVIRFVLLHEAGHISKKTMLRIENILFLFAVSTIIPTSIMYFFVPDFFTRLVFGSIMLILYLIILRVIAQLFLKSLKQGEFDADEYALNKMKTSYDIPNLPKFIDEVFLWMNNVSEDPSIHSKIKSSRFQKIVIKIVGYEDGYHPENEERISYLKNANGL